MDKEKNIEIPFGAKDSELCEAEYTIPEGYEAEIKDGKVIIRKAESEDERIRKMLYGWVCIEPDSTFYGGFSKESVLAWLEKQPSEEEREKERDYAYRKGLSDAQKALKEQKPAEWSEEDEKILKGIIDEINANKSAAPSYDIKVYNKFLSWLKSLRPQPKQEWSKDDIDMIDWLIRCCEKEHEELCNDKYGHQEIISDLKRECRKKWDWLESLKNRLL